MGENKTNVRYDTAQQLKRYFEDRLGYDCSSDTIDRALANAFDQICNLQFADNTASKRIDKLERANSNMFEHIGRLEKELKDLQPKAAPKAAEAKQAPTFGVWTPDPETQWQGWIKELVECKKKAHLCESVVYVTDIWWVNTHFVVSVLAKEIAGQSSRILGSVYVGAVITEGQIKLGHAVAQSTLSSMRKLTEKAAELIADVYKELGVVTYSGQSR
jgi:hypothetical protein